jgi:Elongation factor SelB, winged helix
MVMKYNAFIVQLKHRDASFTGSFAYEEEILSVNFKKIGKDLFIANFKNQLQFQFLQQVPLIKKNKDFVVLLPELSKYNKRKLTKISKYLEDQDFNDKDTKEILVNLLMVEKFIQARELLEFFNIDPEEMIPFLLRKEILKLIKIIDFTYLTITSFDTIAHYREAMETIFTDNYTSRTKFVKLIDIEHKLKLPQSTLLFKYLLRVLKDSFAYKIMREKIIFQRLALSETEQGSLDNIENLLQTNKINIFSIENILHIATDMTYKDINATLWFMIENGQVVQLNEKFFILTEDLNKIINKLKKFKRNQGEMIDIQAFRELTQYSRKYIITIFEYFDGNQITERVENQRRILLSA